MKAPKMPITQWLVSKIVCFLSTKEGYQIDNSEDTTDGATLIVRDVFGYQYEIKIKCTGRVQDPADPFSRNTQRFEVFR